MRCNPKEYYIVARAQFKGWDTQMEPGIGFFWDESPDFAGSMLGGGGT